VYPIYTVTTRLLALMLGIIIGSPACWCCEPVAAVPAEKAEHVCCHAADKAPASEAPTGQSDKCPCSSTLTKRDVPAMVALPQLVWSLAIALPLWENTEVLPAASMTVLPSTVRSDESPPGVASVLYLQHCALLL